MRLGDKVAVLAGADRSLYPAVREVWAGRRGMSEINAARLKAASALGASRVLNALREDVVKEVEKITGIGADVAFECAGAKPTLQQALELVRMGGRVMLIALAWEQVNCLPVDWVGREVELKACYEYYNSEWVVAMGLVEAKKIRTEPMVTKIIPLTDIDPMFKELLKPDTDQIQAVVACN
jgi:threonine dehydrogenase-like Zn-dependent dehydrogenase